MNPQQLFSSLEAKYRLPEGYLSRVYQLESSSGKNLYNEQSGAAGPFQFMPGTAEGMGLQDPYDLAQSADAAARLAAQNRAYLQKKGVGEVDGRVLYLAHVQGADGAYRLMENADKPATSVVGEKPVVQNAGRPEQKAGEFAGSLMDRYQPAQAAQEGPYSALGESAPVDQASDAAPAQAARETDSGDERRRARALNTLLSISQGLQQETRVQPMPAPRLSYAEGGIVNFGPEVPGFYDGGFVDYGFSAPSYSYSPAFEAPTYSYSFTSPDSYSYTPTEVYSPPFVPPVVEYSYTPPDIDSYTPYAPPVYEYPVPVVPDLFEGSRLDYTSPVNSYDSIFYTVPTYTGDFGLTNRDLYTGEPGYTGVPGSVFTDALVDAGYGQPTEYIGVATNPPGYMQPVFDNIMETIVLPAVGADPRATATELTPAELAAQAIGPLDTPGLIPGNANLATIVGTGRSANEVAAEQAAARTAAAEQAARDQAALTALQSGMAGIYGTTTEAGLGQMTPASSEAASSTLTAIGEAPLVPPAPAPAPSATPDDLLSSILGINPRETARELTAEELAQQAVGPFDRGPIFPAAPAEQPASNYSPTYINSLTNAFLRLNETGETVSQEEALAATRALLASREQGVTLSARAALEQGRAELAPPAQPTPEAPSEPAPPVFAPSPELQAGLLAGPTDTSAFKDATFNPDFNLPPPSVAVEEPTVFVPSPVESTLGFTPSQGFTGQQPAPAPAPVVEPPVVAPPVVEPPAPVPVVAFDPTSFFGAPRSVAPVPETTAYVPVGTTPPSAFVLGGIESQTPGSVSGEGVPGLENTDRGGFDITGPAGYGSEYGPVVSNYIMPDLSSFQTPIPPTIRLDDFGQNVRQQNIPQLGETSYGTFSSLFGPTGSTVAAPPSPPSPSTGPIPLPGPVSTGTLRIPIMPSLSEGLPTFPTGGTVAPVRPSTSTGSTFFTIPGMGGGGGGAAAPLTPTTPPSEPNPSILYDLADFLNQSSVAPRGVSPYVGIGPLMFPEMYVPQFAPSAPMAPMAPAGMRPISDINLPEFGPIPADSSSAPSTE